jgi:hypothetical protein
VQRGLLHPTRYGLGGDEEAAGGVGERHHVGLHEQQDAESLGRVVAAPPGPEPLQSDPKHVGLFPSLGQEQLQLLDPGHEGLHRVGGLPDLGQEEPQAEGEELAGLEQGAEGSRVEASALGDGDNDAVVECGAWAHVLLVCAL